MKTKTITIETKGATVTLPQFAKDDAFPTEIRLRVVDANGNELKDLNGTPMELRAGKRGFKTGSYGWNANGKIEVNGHSVQVGVNLILVGAGDRTKAECERLGMDLAAYLQGVADGTITADEEPTDEAADTTEVA